MELGKSIEAYRNLGHKHEVDKVLGLELHILLVAVLFDMKQWCDERDIPFVITETVTTREIDDSLGRVSDSHRTKRAIDLRSRVFTPEQRVMFRNTFNARYRHIASISSSDFEKRLVVEHGEGFNRHFHIALHKRYSLKEKR